MNAIIGILRDGYGVQSFRVWSAYIDKRDEHALDTLKYFSKGRHVGFVCDRCGDTDFFGIRYKCTVCHDFDLCEKCQTRWVVVFLCCRSRVLLGFYFWCWSDSDTVLFFFLCMILEHVLRVLQNNERGSEQLSFQVRPFGEQMGHDKKFQRPLH